MTDHTLNERLSSYLDGELDDEAAADIEKRIAQDGNLAEELGRLRELRCLMTGAFDELLKEPVPLALAGNVQRRFTESNKRHQGNTQLQDRGAPKTKIWTTALIAASIAAVVAFSAGYLLSGSIHTNRVADLREQLHADRQVFADLVSQTLEKHLSGDVVQWRNEESGSSGSVRPVRTFRNSNGEWCREYNEQMVLGDERWSRSAIACRIGEGRWDTRVIALDES